MSWLSIASFEPALPAHCEPTTDFLLRFSSTFHTCVPTPLAFTSNLLGTLSIVAWLFAQLPQIYKNWSISSTSGLSIFFLAEWFLGDLGNLLGALFTHQASWQVTIGAYYVFVDLCLLGQWMWYERLRHGNLVRIVRSKMNPRGDYGDAAAHGRVVIDGMRVNDESSSDEGNKSAGKGQVKASQPSRPRIIFRTPTFEYDRKSEELKASSATPNGTTIYRVGPSSPMPSPSPRTVLLIACLIAITQASPLQRGQRTTTVVSTTTQPTPLEFAGTILSWTSTVCYLGSRLPQLYKNWSRKSTAGLSPHLFIAAFTGNLLYSSALLSNPYAWETFGPYGGGGWAGPKGSVRMEWVLAALPFFLGAAGVLGLDASVGLQFIMYGDNAEKVVVVEEGRDHKRHWRKVSGWMRGWIPSISDTRYNERDALIERDDRHGNGYDTLR